MAKIISPERLGGVLKEVLDEFKEKSKKDIELGVRAAWVQLGTNIIKETPMDEGRARSNWFSSTRSPSKRVSESTNEDKLRVKEIKAAADRWDLSKRLFLTNNLSYIGVLEFGGYPNPVKKGTQTSKPGTRKNPNSPATFEIRSINGFSKLAPKGMVRVNILKWRKLLKTSLKVI